MSYDFWNFVRHKLFKNAYPYRREIVIERTYVDEKVVKSVFRVFMSNHELPFTPLSIFTDSELKFFNITSGRSPPPSSDPTPSATSKPLSPPVSGKQSDEGYSKLKEVRREGGLREKLETALEENGVRPGGQKERRRSHVSMHMFPKTGLPFAARGARGEEGWEKSEVGSEGG